MDELGCISCSTINSRTTEDIKKWPYRRMDGTVYHFCIGHSNEKGD